MMLNASISALRRPLLKRTRPAPRASPVCLSQRPSRCEPMLPCFRAAPLTQDWREILAGTGSYARGDQPRSVPDTLAQPYARMVTQQRAYNAQQAAALERRRNGAEVVAPKSAPRQRAAVAPLADRMYRGSDADIAELRRQQAEFKQTERAISRENAWMAIPALAPAVAVMGLEGAAYIAGRLAPAVVRRTPHVMERADPYLRVGDNWSTRAGRRAHAELKGRVAQKQGWKPEPTVPLQSGRILRPDVRTSARVRKPGKEAEPFQMELKPNTPSGRAAAARAIKKYEATGVKTRPIFYDPKPFI